MRFDELITRMNSLVSDEEVANYYKALRQNSVIWEGFKDLESEDPRVASISRQAQLLNAGTLALTTFDSEFNFKALAEKRLTPAMLEKVMLGYEEYLLSGSAVENIAQAGRLALALTAKAWDAGNWTGVFQELLERMKLGDEEQFERCWLPVLIVVFNLMEDKPAILAQLLASDTIGIVLSSLVKVVLCLPSADEYKTTLLKERLLGLDEQAQVHALRVLKQTGGNEITVGVAVHLMEKYRELDLSDRSTREYWQNPLASTRLAFKYQAVADIAMMAEENDTALQLNEKALTILGALVKKGKVKKAGIIRQDQAADRFADIFVSEELSDPDIQAELVYTLNEDELSSDVLVHPVKAIQQSKQLSAAGNPEMAREEIESKLLKLSDRELEELLVEGPDLIQAWEPVALLQTLLDVGAYEAVQRVAAILLRDNPTSVPVNLAAAKSAEALGDRRAVVNHWETLVYIQPDALDHKRKLAEAYVTEGRPDLAYHIYKGLTSRQEQVEKADLLAMAELALMVEKPADVMEAAEKVLEMDEENGRAYTLHGIARGKMGYLPAAEADLRKAILFSEDDNRPWLELAEMHWSAGAHTEAIAALKEGLAANPGETSIQSRLARKMMLDGLVSEAYPLLADLSKRGNDLDSDLLLIEAMETLGMEGVPEMLQLMTERYPDDARFYGEYGKRLVWSGETEKGLQLLMKLGDELESNQAWKMAYLEAVYKPDYSILVLKPKVEKRELTDALAFLDDYLSADPENEFARLLKAELLFSEGRYDLSYQIFVELQRANLSRPVVHQARLFTGLSLVAAACGELEIASSALDQAYELEPRWYSLQALKAHLLHLSGDDDQAAAQVFKAIELAPSSAENQAWAVEMLQKVDRQAEAAKLLKESLTAYPDHLGLNLLTAEIMLNGNPVTGKSLDGDQLYGLLQGEVDAEQLVRAAAVFAESGDPERTVWCLEQAVTTGSEAAQLNLAGLHRINHDYQSALEALGQFETSSAAIDLLKTETAFASGETEIDQTALAGDKVFNQKLPFLETFLPAEWKELLQSSKPVVTLGFKVAMQTGQFDAVAAAVRDWINAEPGSIEGRVFGIEMALASTDVDWYEQLMSSEFEPQAEVFGSQYSLLRDEYYFDQGAHEAGHGESSDFFESIHADEPEKLAVIRQLRQVGRLAEAEKTYEMATGVFLNLDEKPLVIRLGMLRNLAKCAFDLDRWEEAIDIIHRSLEIAPASEGLIILHRQALALALEFQNRAQALAVSVHGYAGVREYTENIVQSVDNLSISQPGQAALDHWTNRLRLAYEAKNEHIRALARHTPSPDDAAAMMAGLRNSGQVKTALLVGKKYTQQTSVLLEAALCVQDAHVKDALTWLEKSLELDPFQPLALRLQSLLLEKTGAIPESVNALESALELWPNESKWHITAADLWKRLGHTERPVAHLQIASTYVPQDVEVKKLLGTSYLSAGNLNAALSNLTAVVEKNPQDYDTWIALSELYQATGDLEPAMHAAERASEVNPNGVKACLQAGRISWAKGDLKQATAHAESAIALDPADPANYVFLARLAREQGNTAKALELLEKAAGVDPAPLQTVIEHANLIKEINGVVAARDLIAEFSRKFPENPDLLTLLAEAEDQCGDLPSAESAAKKALDIKPTEQAIHLLLGRIVEKYGNLDQAAHYYSQAVSLDGARIDGYLKLSQVYIKQREFQKARRVLEQGIGKIPGNVDLYLSCAALLKESKDYRGAEQMLRKASQIEPRNVAIHRQLGAILALNMVHQSQEVGSQV
jgi:tetratricopeptide (TPR) repeat protein